MRRIVVREVREPVQLAEHHHVVVTGLEPDRRRPKHDAQVLVFQLDDVFARGEVEAESTPGPPQDRLVGGFAIAEAQNDVLAIELHLQGAILAVHVGEDRPARIGELVGVALDGEHIDRHRLGTGGEGVEQAEQREGPHLSVSFRAQDFTSSPFSG